eukprot:2651307-Rhodomonas_salina.2
MNRTKPSIQGESLGLCCVVCVACPCRVPSAISPARFHPHDEPGMMRAWELISSLSAHSVLVLTLALR